MSLHSVSWRVIVSALDQNELIEDSLKWISGEKSEVEITKDTSYHGSQQFTIVVKNKKKKGAKRSLQRLGRDALLQLLENDIQKRVDEDKYFHVRIKLSNLVRGEIMLADNNTTTSTVKGKFKIESYPGESAVDVISSLIKELI